MPKAKLLLTLSLALILAGCAGQSSKHRDTPMIAEASERFRNGDYAGASQIYQRLAEQSDDKDYFRLLAADAELRAGNDRAAQALLGAINPDELAEGDQQRYALLRARLDLNHGSAREAMARLDGIDYQKLTSPLRAHYHILRASAYNQLGNMLECARERVYYGQLTNNPEAIQQNNEAIFEALNRVDYKVLTAMQPSTQGTLGGWMALNIAQRSSEPNRTQALQVWRAAYPPHPANGAFVQGLLAKKGKTVELTPLRPLSPEAVAPAPKPVPLVAATPAPQPASPSPASPPPVQAPAGGFIGVMLPLTGAYAQAAQAVRSGLSAAWGADTNTGRPELRFVDTQGGDVWAIYRKLSEDGARFVIGPLLKEEVAALARGGEFTVPVLALNQALEANSRTGIYQFALTPEQEVEQAASLAWFDGRQNALLLAPASAFGQRMINHFSTYWKSLGGKIANIKTYQPGAADYSDTAKRLVSTVAGEAGAAAASTPPPEFIFMIADSRDGRLLNPHIENQESNHIPVYATSLIYNGQANAPQNADLSGVIFCDSPWLLNNDTGVLSRKSMQTVAEQTPEVYLRLLPMGIDAYQLVPQLNLMKNAGQTPFSGATGVLTLRGNRLNRQLHCAQFDENNLQPRGIAPTLQPSDSPNVVP